MMNNGKSTQKGRFLLCSVSMMLRSVLLMVLMIIGGVNSVWGATVTYHIINLGRLDNNGQPGNTRTEALQFTVTDDNVTVGIPEKYKSPLAKNWAYYSSSTLESSLNVGDALSDGADVYVTYELDEAAFNTVGVENGGIYRIKFSNNFYLQQSMYNNEINTASQSVSNPTASEYLWKFNIVDPYQITIQSQSNSYPNYYLSNKTNNNNFADIRLQSTLAAAQATKAWAFSLIPGGTSGTYRLIVADGSTVAPTTGNNGNYLDSFGHGYLNNNRKGNKTTYHLYNNTTGNEVNNTSYARCDLTIEPVTKNYIIVNNSGTPLVQALTEANTLEVPDVIKSPLASYTYYGTQQNAIDEANPLSSVTGATIYVRYTTNNDVLNLKGEIKYNISVGGTNYLYAADETMLSSETTSENNAINNRKWLLMGNDAYQITIKNVGNNNEITYDVSSGEAAPTLSATGSKFFFHQTNSGGYEVVAITSNDYSTPNYYTLGLDGGNLKLYSNSSHAFGDSEVQSLFTPRPMAAITAAPTANSLTYNGLNQELVTSGTALNGTIKYCLGVPGSYVDAVPTAKDADTYNVYYMAEGSDGYEDNIVADPIIVTIAQALLTVTADDKNIIYGSAAPAYTFSYSGFVNDETAEVITTAPTVTCSYTSNSNAGTYDIVACGGETTNYSFTYENGTLTVDPKTVKDDPDTEAGESAVTIVMTDIPEGNFTYDGTAKTPTVTVKDGETVIASSEYTLDFSDNTNAGTATVTITDNDGGNYQVSGATTFTINPAALTITPDNGQSKSFGDPDPVLTYANVGLVEGDELTGALGRAAGEDAGTYAITQGTLDDSHNPNYTITVITTGKTFTITAKSLGSGTTPAENITIEITEADEDHVTVKQGGTPLTAGTEGTDYDYSISTTGSASDKYFEVTITGANNYEGSFTTKFANVTFGTKTNRHYWGGFVSDDGDGDFTVPSDMAAYIVTGINASTGTVEVELLDNIPEQEPVLLLTNKDAHGFVVKAKADGTDPTGNLLEEAATDMSVTTAQIYVLYKGEFVLNAAGTLKAGKVYLPRPAEAPAPAILTIDFGGTSGIEEIPFSTTDAQLSTGWYTLEGIKLNGRPVKKGLYLRDGKKIVVK